MLQTTQTELNLGEYKVQTVEKKNSETKKTHTQILVNTTKGLVLGIINYGTTCSIHSHDGSMERTAYGISTDPWMVDFLW